MSITKVDIDAQKYLNKVSTEDLLYELEDRGFGREYNILKDELFELYSIYRTLSDEAFKKELEKFFQNRVDKTK